MAKSLLWHLERMALADEPTPEPVKRKHTPMSAETRTRMRIASEVGYDLRVLQRQTRGPGRPPGSKNKPKPEGYIAEPKLRGAYITDTLTHSNVGEHFVLVNGIIRRLDRNGRYGLDCRVKPKGPKHGEWQAWHVRYGGRYYLAVEVAWWLIHKRQVRDNHYIWCEDLMPYPRYEESTLTELRVPEKKDGSTGI